MTTFWTCHEDTRNPEAVAKWQAWSYPLQFTPVGGVPVPSVTIDYRNVVTSVGEQPGVMQVDWFCDLNVTAVYDDFTEDYFHEYDIPSLNGTLTFVPQNKVILYIEFQTNMIDFADRIPYLGSTTWLWTGVACQPCMVTAL